MSAPADALRYLSFELSEDTDGVCTLDAEASTGPDDLPAVMAEVQQVLDWARQGFRGHEGPLDEGHDWDHALHVAVAPGRDHDWHTVSLTLSGTPAFARAFEGRFGDALT